MPLIEQEKEKRLYEMAYLLPVTLELKEIGNYNENLKKKILEVGGEITAEPMPQKKRLAYPIKKQGQAYFGFMRFKIFPENLKIIDKDLKLDTQLLRYLFTVLTPQQIAEEEKLSKQLRRESIRRQKVSVKPKPAPKETPKEIKAEEFEEKMKEVEKAIE